MREIKFRAWDEKTAKMIGPCTLKNAAGLFPWTERSSFAQYESCPEYHPVKVMQWTGVSDKNGREIYEGDIVSVFREYTGKMVHGEEVVTGEWQNAVVRWVAAGFWLDGSEFQHWPSLLPDMEVLGNIYENPELLPGASPRPEASQAEGPP